MSPSVLPRGMDPGRWAGARQRWIDAAKDGRGQVRARRVALAQDLGISPTALYRAAKKLGWPRGHYSR